ISLLPRFPWLRKLCEERSRWYEPLLRAPQTVIHGEFYSKTLLLRGHRIYILDWESAAFAAGEIDLAALTEGVRWTARLVQQCIEAYRQARWPRGVPATFQQTLETARMYLHFRWLGERADWTVRETSFWRYG